MEADQRIPLPGGILYLQRRMWHAGRDHAKPNKRAKTDVRLAPPKSPQISFRLSFLLSSSHNIIVIDLYQAKTLTRQSIKKRSYTAEISFSQTCYKNLQRTFSKDSRFAVSHRTEEFSHHSTVYVFVLQSLQQPSAAHAATISHIAETL